MPEAMSDSYADKALKKGGYSGVKPSGRRNITDVMSAFFTDCKTGRLGVDTRLQADATGL
jgi:hypothetical protein